MPEVEITTEQMQEFAVNMIGYIVRKYGVEHVRNTARNLSMRMMVESWMAEYIEAGEKFYYKFETDSEFKNQIMHAIANDVWNEANGKDK